MSEHAVLLAVQRQVQGLVDEKAALQAQIDGLVDERNTLRLVLAECQDARDALCEQNGGLKLLLANARQRLDYYRKLYTGQIAEGDQT
jgi:FtsZ-binding cell division protein ZapB